MSDMSLVVRMGSLTEMESALTRASQQIEEQITGLLEKVNTQIAGWSPSTSSRQAEMAYQARLREGVARLTAALDQVRTALAEVRDSARETEVENVALLG